MYSSFLSYQIIWAGSYFSWFNCTTWLACNQILFLGRNSSSIINQVFHHVKPEPDGIVRIIKIKKYTYYYYILYNMLPGWAEVQQLRMAHSLRIKWLWQSQLGDLLPWILNIDTQTYKHMFVTQLTNNTYRTLLPPLLI